MKTILLFITAGLMSACALPAQCDTTAIVVDTCEFRTMLNRHDGVLIDVRTPQEWQTGHIPGAINIDFRGADFKACIAELDTTRTYYVYCEVGGRAHMAAEYMIAQGFCRVVLLQGGMRLWKMAGYEVTIPGTKNKK